jgi:hypothetical protein
MINRDSWGYSYFSVRGEILGFLKDELLRKHLSRMFSLIKNESPFQNATNGSRTYYEDKPVVDGDRLCGLL